MSTVVERTLPRYSPDEYATRFAEAAELLRRAKRCVRERDDERNRMMLERARKFCDSVIDRRPA